MRAAKLWIGLLTAIAPAGALSADDETAPWQAAYEVPPTDEAMAEPGWMLRAGISDAWGYAQGMVTLMVPRNRADGAWIEFRMPKDWERPSPSLDVFVEDEVRFRLLGELVTFLEGPDVDPNGTDEICLDPWGADVEFIVDGRLVRELSGSACYHNEALFEFTMTLSDAILAELRDCRAMEGGWGGAFFTLRDCTLLAGDSALAGRHFAALEEIHQNWPNSEYLGPDTHVEWDRSGIAREDEEEDEAERDRLPLDGDVRVEFLAVTGLPQCEVELRARYYEDFDEGTYKWDAREVWAFAPEGKPELVSLTANNLHVIRAGED
jgi:hypothetical protein